MFKINRSRSVKDSFGIQQRIITRGWRALGMVDPGDGGPSRWDTLGMAERNDILLRNITVQNISEQGIAANL